MGGVRFESPALSAMLRRQFQSLAGLLIPVRHQELAIALLGNLFPLATAVYLMVWSTPSVSWLTKTLFLVILLLWARRITLAQVLETRATVLDGVMAVFFCFAVFGHIRSGYPDLTFEYFVALNVIAYFVGRYTRFEGAGSLIAYYFVFALVLSLGAILALPELYHQWDVGGPKHPTLYEVISTAGGLDVTLGCLPVLSGVILLMSADLRPRSLRLLLQVCLGAGMVLLILIASKSVILAAVLTLVAIMIIQYRRWRRALMLLSICAGSTLFAVAVAPENNLNYYGLNSPTDWVTTLKSAPGPALPAQAAGPGSKGSGAASRSYGPIAIAGEFDEPDTGVARIKLARMAWMSIVDNPLFGIGVRDWDYFSPHPHNVFIESALVFGVPSLLALLLFYALAILQLLVHRAGWTTLEHTRYAMVAALLLFLLCYNLVQGQLASFRSLPLFVLSGYAGAMVAHINQLSRAAGGRTACP